jgi:hypothetical protein
MIVTLFGRISVATNDPNLVWIVLNRCDVARVARQPNQHKNGANPLETTNHSFGCTVKQDDRKWVFFRVVSRVDECIYELVYRQKTKQQNSYG